MSGDQVGKDEVPDGLLNGLEVEIHTAVLRREKSSGSCPDRDALAAMEESLNRLTGATVLFTDLAMVRRDDPPASPMGLSFLSHAMYREALRLFRLYHGHPPGYQQFWPGDGGRQ